MNCKASHFSPIVLVKIRRFDSSVLVRMWETGPPSAGLWECMLGTTSVKSDLSVYSLSHASNSTVKKLISHVYSNVRVMHISTMRSTAAVSVIAELELV